MLDFIELHAYSSLLMIFAFIITMAVVSMAFGSSTPPPKQGASPSFFVEYLISIILVPIAETLLELMLKNKLFSPSRPMLFNRSYLVRRVHAVPHVHWRTDIYSFQLISKSARRYEWALFALYMSVTLHGLAGVLYVHLSHSEAVSNFQTQNMELFCLMSIYMYSACLAPPLKVLRYLYLFRYLPNKYQRIQLSQSSPPHSIEYQVEVCLGGASGELCCAMCLQEIKTEAQGYVRDLPCKCGTAFHASCVDRWFNVQGHLNCPGCLKMLMTATPRKVFTRKGNYYLPAMLE